MTEPNPPSPVTVAATGDGVIEASAGAGLVRRPEAEALCAGIRDAAHRFDRPGLLLDMGALSRATPAAGFYALRQARSFPVGRIALVGAGRFMRAFARVVLRMGRFPRRRFFDDRGDAERWLREESRSTEDRRGQE